jgi:cholesterol transport system auxiliary component
MTSIHRPSFLRACVRAAAVATIATLPLATGCSAFSRPAPSGALYLLDPPMPAPRDGGALGSVLVRRFTVTPPFDGRPLLYRTTNGTWRADPYDGFAADPADMMTSALFGALEASGRFRLVAAEGVLGRFDHQAEGCLEAFYADFANAAAPEAVVRMRVYVVRRIGATREMLAVRTVEGRAPITARTAAGCVDALSAATAKALEKVVGDLPASTEAMDENAIERAQKAD